MSRDVISTNTSPDLFCDFTDNQLNYPLMFESRSAIYKMLKDQAHKDRQINVFPAPYRSDATPYTQQDFSKVVKEACTTSRPVMAGLKISKAVFLGDVGVGKTSLINR
uniref:Uncharacterized protein n=1 Tax=Timema cristinae TaxID=61476 RepID=A0A7R9DFL6_TIMCR|nr:unnamed protein product [Timema cristinae]